MCHRLAGLIAADKRVFTLTKDIDQSLDELRVVSEGPTGEGVETRGKGLFLNESRLRAEAYINDGMEQEVFSGFLNIANGFKENPCIHVEECTDAMQHIRARKTVACEVAVELGAVDVELTAECGDRRILVRQQAKIGAEHAAQFCRCRSRRAIQIFVCHPNPHRCLKGLYILSDCPSGRYEMRKCICRDAMPRHWEIPDDTKDRPKFRFYGIGLVGKLNEYPCGYREATDVRSCSVGGPGGS